MVSGVVTGTNSSSPAVPSRHMRTANEAGPSSTVTGWCHVPMA